MVAHYQLDAQNFLTFQQTEGFTRSPLFVICLIYSVIPILANSSLATHQSGCHSNALLK